MRTVSEHRCNRRKASETHGRCGLVPDGEREHRFRASCGEVGRDWRLGWSSGLRRPDGRSRSVLVLRDAVSKFGLDHVVCLRAKEATASTYASGSSMCGTCPTPVNVRTSTDDSDSASLVMTSANSGGL